jgi:hypothetical protein
MEYSGGLTVSLQQEVSFWAHQEEKLAILMRVNEAVQKTGMVP